jgi:ABC-type dipeptide/oligopeptide/nickel transport system permease subunit
MTQIAQRRSEPEPLARRRESRQRFSRLFIVRLMRIRGAGVGLVVIAIVVVAALASPLVAPYDPDQVDTSALLADPSAAHPLGTDVLGRDVLSRVIYGARISLIVGLISVVVAAGVGVPIGLLAGYAGSAVDTTLMRIMDGVIAFPALVLALALIATLGSSLSNVMLALGIVAVPTYARIARAQVLSLKAQDFVTAARLVGAHPLRLILRHILPNAMAPLVVVATFGFATAIVAEASLSFLGLGVRPPTATWGNLLLDGFQFLRLKPMLSIAPGTAIFLLVLSINFVGDGLRDLLDPRLRGVV